jgi:hypothetical protein
MTADWTSRLLIVARMCAVGPTIGPTGVPMTTTVYNLISDHNHLQKTESVLKYYE